MPRRRHLCLALGLGAMLLGVACSPSQPAPIATDAAPGEVAPTDGGPGDGGCGALPVGSGEQRSWTECPAAFGITCDDLGRGGYTTACANHGCWRCLAGRWQGEAWDCPVCTCPSMAATGWPCGTAMCCEYQLGGCCGRTVAGLICRCEAGYFRCVTSDACAPDAGCPDLDGGWPAPVRCE
ncbi:MAG TPA: hypothetical protein VGQ83_32780 [Polyangia bacterium]|jgi:hypothetical protein